MQQPAAPDREKLTQTEMWIAGDSKAKLDALSKLQLPQEWSCTEPVPELCSVVVAMQQLVATDREKLTQTRKSAAGKTAKAKLDALSRVQLPRRQIALKQIVSCVQLWDSGSI